MEQTTFYIYKTKYKTGQQFIIRDFFWVPNPNQPSFCSPCTSRHNNKKNNKNNNNMQLSHIICNIYELRVKFSNRWNYFRKHHSFILHCKYNPHYASFYRSNFQQQKDVQNLMCSKKTQNSGSSRCS